MYGSPPPAPPKDLNRPFSQATHQMSSGLLRYRSAPSSLFEGCDSFLPARPSSPDTATMFSRFLSSQSGGGGCRQRNSQLPPPSPQPPPSTAEENMGGGLSSAATSSPMMYQHHHHHQNQMMASSTLIRQSSSPAGLFSNLKVETGYGVTKGITGFRNGNESEGLGTGNRLRNHLSLSSRQPSSLCGLMSQISEIDNESTDGGGDNGDYPMAAWEESSLLCDNNFSSLGLKRPTHNQTENGGLRNQFSLPKTSSELAGIEKFLQFQDSVPCRIRAKRGCATHPRSIAERVRRTRISERMRKLQELVPNMDKQTNTADMLDLAVDYIKDLQKHVKTLSDGRANCNCSSRK